MNDFNPCLHRDCITPAPASGSLSKFLTSRVQMVWQRLGQWLFASQECQVQQRVDRAGNAYWQAYNPVTGHSLISGSRTEVLAWIEQEFYR